MRKAIMLCAGRGKRLGHETDNKPKPLTMVNNKSILKNSVQNLISQKYTDLTIVIGYKGDLIIKELYEFEQDIKINYIKNEKWETTNNIYSLWLARNELIDGVTLLEGDIYFDNKVLEILNSGKRDNYLLVSKLNNLMEGTCVVVDDNNKVVDFCSTKDSSHLAFENPLKTLNIYKLSGKIINYIINALNIEIHNGNVNAYYESVFIKALEKLIDFTAIEVSDELWYEIDNTYDLEVSEFKFSDEKLKLLKKQHGGYWRYPVKDFALIYNFHFPPRELKNKIIDRFNDVLLNYPSNSLFIEKHLSRFLNIPKEKLLIANGVSEIIKILPRILEGEILLLEPSFNEYENSFGRDRVIPFALKEETNFELDVDKLLDVIKGKKPANLVLITPDNPSGKILSKDTIERIYSATEELNTRIFVDESFIDFSDYRDTMTFINSLDLFPRIIVLKSMSKTFGIGGLRLGYAASADINTLNKIKSELPIWNINGFAEEFILNLPQFKKEYLISCDKVRDETDMLVKELKGIESLKVFDTDSNFIMCKILDKKLSANKLASTLLNDYNIYIKECSGKAMKDSEYFIRISSRTSADNNYLVLALKDIFHNIDMHTHKLDVVTI